MICLEEAGVQRDSGWLVRGVDLTVMPREIVTLIGPNGSGKSTTAKMALGILKPTEGRASQRPRLKVGYVPQKLMIDWTLPLTVNRFMRLTSKLTPSEVSDALSETSVSHLGLKEVRHLSGGELQRVLLARAIARKPDLLVLDEPVQGVDYSGEAAIYRLISEIRDRLGCGILMISHDLHVVMAATDQVVCLNGHVCCRGTPGDVSQSEAFQQMFGHRADSALAVYEHHHDHVHLPDGRVRLEDGTVTDHCPSHGHGHDGHTHSHDTKVAAGGGHRHAK